MAKAFVFRLETLLKLRQQREDRQKRVVAERLREIARVRREIESVEAQIQAQTDAVRADVSAGRIDVTKVARNRHWLSYLHRKRLEAQGHMGVLEARLAQERAVLAHAAKERKVLETLKDRQRDRYRRELDRQEVLEADDLSTVRFVFARETAEVHAE